MICKICKQDNKTIFSAKVLNKYNVKYYHCVKCGFLQTEDPHWLSEAYTESINLSDTGYIMRNTYFSKKLTILLALFFYKGSKFLDYASGYGVFVRQMRDVGFDFYWDDKYTPNLFSKGFEFDISHNYEAITTFESFEHFENPIKEIEKMLKVSKNIIFSTQTLPNPVPDPNNWWYYGLEHGQHISIYSYKTLEFIANKYDLNYYDLGGLHIFTNKTIPFYAKWLLRLSKYGLHKLIQKNLNSKTWEDHLKTANENIV